MLVLWVQNPGPTRWKEKSHSPVILGPHMHEHTCADRCTNWYHKKLKVDWFWSVLLAPTANLVFTKLVANTIPIFPEPALSQTPPFCCALLLLCQHTAPHVSVPIGVAVSYSSVTVLAMAFTQAFDSQSVRRAQPFSKSGWQFRISTLYTLSQKEALIICLTNMHIEHSPAKSSLPPTNPLLFVCAVLLK